MQDCLLPFASVSFGGQNRAKGLLKRCLFLGGTNKTLFEHERLDGQWGPLFNQSLVLQIESILDRKKFCKATLLGRKPSTSLTLFSLCPKKLTKMVDIFESHFWV
jgi:hypothetical protein